MNLSTATRPPTAITRQSVSPRVAFALIMSLMGLALGVSGVPAPLYGVYEQEWHLSPITTTIVFAAYAVAALGAVLVAGSLSDRIGRRPVMLASVALMIAGLVVFMTADDVTALLVARVLHGAGVGSVVVAGGAALLDLRPEMGARTGQLTGIIFNLGIGAAVLGSSVLAEVGPRPLVTPYAIVGVLAVVMLAGLVATAETHRGRGTTPLRIARPRVPTAIRHDFRFAALGVMAAWSVLGVYLSLFPALAGQETHIHHLVFGGAVVAVMAAGAAVSQWWGGRNAARPMAIVGDVVTAVALVLSIPALWSHHASLVILTALLLGAGFGLAFGSSLRHLGQAIPAAHRGEVMSAFYVLAYGAMAVPTVVAGWAATHWSLAGTYPWFALAVALACLTAAGLGARTNAEEHA